MEGTNVMSTLITQIGSLLTSVTGWITAVYTWAVSEPLILFIMALGFVGVMFRWARTLVNFIRG